MSKYSGRTVSVARSAQEIADKFADLSQFSAMLDRIPEEERAKIGDVTFDTDSVAINTKQVGTVRFQVVERTPQAVRLSAVGSPVPLTMSIDLDATSPNTTDVTTNIDIDIPVMLRPMVGPHLQKAVDQFSDLVAKLAV